MSRLRSVAKGLIWSQAYATWLQSCILWPSWVLPTAWPFNSNVLMIFLLSVKHFGKQKLIKDIWNFFLCTYRGFCKLIPTCILWPLANDTGHLHVKKIYEKETIYTTDLWIVMTYELLFITSCHIVIYCHILSYADDSNVFINGKNTSELADTMNVRWHCY